MTIDAAGPAFSTRPKRRPWNHGHLIGQKPPLKLREVWSIRIRLQLTVLQWISRAKRKSGDYLFPSRIEKNKPSTTRHYSRLMNAWAGSIGLDPALYGTHSLRRTKVALIYRRRENFRAVQLLLGHTKLESTVRYLGIEVDDALAISEQVDI